MTEKQLIKRLKEIGSMGFVKSHRHESTGIGKTLEDLLGVKENNLRLPDLGEIELKAKSVEGQHIPQGGPEGFPTCCVG